MLAVVIPPDAVAAFVGVLAIVVVAVIRRLLTHNADLRGLGERVARLEGRLDQHENEPPRPRR